LEHLRHRSLNLEITEKTGSNIATENNKETFILFFSFFKKFKLEIIDVSYHPKLHFSTINC